MKGRLFVIFLASILGKTLCSLSNMGQPYDTIIIGMGAAGATAASALARAGKSLLALEAEDRIGGRVKTVPFGGGVVEVGAEWIHGTEKSRVYDIAVKNNISTIPESVEFEVYKSDGSRCDQELMSELVDFCLNVVQHPPEENERLGNFITRRLIEYLETKHPDLLKDEEVVQEFLQLMNLIINNYESSNDWNDVSAQTCYEELGGEQHMSWHRHGYRTFFEILMNTYNNGPGWPTLEIKLNKEVTTIKWPKDSTGNVEVVCKDGTVYTANNVIVTVSLGVLKERHSTLFQPPLPKEKVHSIENISIGVMDKVVLQFDKPVLHNTMFLGFLWRTEDRRKVAREDQWTTKIFGCSTPLGARTAVTFWTSGEAGKLVETLPEDVVKRRLLELFRMFMGSSMEVQEPTGMVRSTWYSNPYTRGSYSYDNYLAHEFPNARAVLGEPLTDAAGNPRVLFAGEATDLTHFSTVHGASDSGHREAMRLLSQSKL